MLLQTNSYVVPKEKRSQHARLVRRFKQCLARLGCDDYEVYEQVGTNWTSDPTGGRFVQIMRFRDRRHQMTVQAAERSDPVAQTIIAEFCEIINFPYQQQQGLFAIGYYTSILASTPRALPHVPAAEPLVGQTPIATEPPFASEASAQPSDIDVAVPMVVEEALITQTATEPDLLSESPFADGPPVTELQPIEPELPAAQPAESEFAPLEHAGAGKNGDAANEHSVEVSEQPAVQQTDATQPDEAAAVSLDDLIKQRFGSIEPAPPPEETPDDPQPSEPTLSSSGIGEVLDASLGDDPDLDIALPAELLDGPLAENVHQQREVPSDVSHPNEPNHG